MENQLAYKIFLWKNVLNPSAKLISSQFPQWKDLPLLPVTNDGWDNRSFRLGKKLLVRMPSAAEYAPQVEKEQKWLPKLAPYLPLAIPEPIAMGKPGEGYLWNWSVFKWIEGESASTAHIDDLDDFAKKLAKFLGALQKINPTNGPPPGNHSFHRGGPLSYYDEQMHKALEVLQGKINVEAARALWEQALSTSWQKPPVWVHGDISAGNLLVRKGKLIAVIDFGQLAVGDPACDLAIAWTFFQGTSRKIFQENLLLDAATWIRGKAWALWKAAIVAAGFNAPGNWESQKCWEIIQKLL